MKACSFISLREEDKPRGYVYRLISLTEEERNVIVVELGEGKVAHRVRFEGEMLLKLDKGYNPLHLEVEVKDVIDGLDALSNIKPFGGVEFDGVYLDVHLNEGEPEHWAHFGCVAELELDSNYWPLRMTIEVKDLMGSEGVLRSVGLLATR